MICSEQTRETKKSQLKCIYARYPNVDNSATLILQPMSMRVMLEGRTANLAISIQRPQVLVCKVGSQCSIVGIFFH